jgi:hypothetical protein
MGWIRGPSLSVGEKPHTESRWSYPFETDRLESGSYSDDKTTVTIASTERSELTEEIKQIKAKHVCYWARLWGLVANISGSGSCSMSGSGISGVTLSGTIVTTA